MAAHLLPIRFPLLSIGRYLRLTFHKLMPIILIVIVVVLASQGLHRVAVVPSTFWPPPSVVFWGQLLTVYYSACGCGWDVGRGYFCGRRWLFGVLGRGAGRGSHGRLNGLFLVFVVPLLLSDLDVAALVAGVGLLLRIGRGLVPWHFVVATGVGLPLEYSRGHGAQRM